MTKSSGYLFLLLFPLSMFGQNGQPGDRQDPSLRLNLLRTDVVAPHGQQPRYDWSAVYLNNAFATTNTSQSFRLDSSRCGYGIPNTSQFGEEIMVYYSYDNDGLITGILFKKSTSPGVYENYSRKQFTYNNGLQTNYLYQIWDQTNMNWVDDYEEATSYDGNGRQTEFRIREADANAQWQNLFRERRNYDLDDNLTGVLSARWDNGSWQDTARKQITYNNAGFYTDIYDQSWNGTAWDTLSHEIAMYDNLGMFWEGYMYREKTVNAFQPLFREAYEYDTYGYFSGMVRQRWNKQTSEWENMIREEYAYTRQGIWTGWALQNWKDSSWINHIRQRYFPANAIRQDIMQRWDTTAMDWVNGFRSLTRFDSDNNLIREAGIQRWNIGATEWENTANSYECTHFWSPSPATGIRDQLPDLSCLLTNPYRVYTPIQCESLLPGKQYEVRVTDMQGRTVHQQIVPGGHTFSINRRLPVGIYHLSIFENQQLAHIQKLMIRQ